jgi:hypothetical protein
MLKTVRTADKKSITGLVKPGGVLVPHNLDGPAIINEDGSKEYYIGGIKYSKTDWDKIIKQKKQDSDISMIIE